MQANKICKFCGESSNKYELCYDCYNLSQIEYIIKDKNGNWIENVKFGNEYKFYDKTKVYTLKKDLLNEYEMRFLNIMKKTLKSKFLIIPQVNLQTIIQTNTYTRNDELFRNIDFIIFIAKQFIPILAIELNGRQHYTNEYWKERDNSVKQILRDVNLPLLTIDIKDLKKMSDKEIKEIVLNTLKKI